jgi:hypothetical protein
MTHHDPSKLITPAHEKKILESLLYRPWVHSERGLDELIAQHYTNYGERVRGVAKLVYARRVKANRIR